MSVLSRIRDKLRTLLTGKTVSPNFREPKIKQNWDAQCYHDVLSAAQAGNIDQLDLALQLAERTLDAPGYVAIKCEAFLEAVMHGHQALTEYLFCIHLAYKNKSSIKNEQNLSLPVRLVYASLRRVFPQLLHNEESEQQQLTQKILLDRRVADFIQLRTSQKPSIEALVYEYTS